ncbi:acyltransferase family protein [Leptolyngbyaceae cyanobacterium JSC-12]|nr:acyltransferase family protein [Leptolyngbyaceae cyanobacterium JSC-12]
MSISQVKSDLQSDKLRIKSTIKPDRKLAGFDFLRTVFSIAIVALHSELFLLAGTVTIGSLCFAKLLKANVAYLAVPVFLQMALFLFLLKRKEVGFQYFLRRRLPKLISLYFFWVFSLVLFNFLFKGSFESFDFSSFSIKRLVEFKVSGGNTPFYFFFSLIFVTILAELLVSLFEKLKSSSLRAIVSYSLLASSCILVFLFSTIHLIFQDPSNSSSRVLGLMHSLSQWNYNPLNFLPYIFTTAILVQELNEGKLQSLTLALRLKLYSLGLLFLIFTLLEWHFQEDLLHYSRLSLVFGSWLLLHLSLLSTRKSSPSVRFIAECSLGIYAFHLFFTHFLFVGDTDLSQIFPGIGALIEFFIALFASIALTLLFRKSKILKGFV